MRATVDAHAQSAEEVHNLPLFVDPDPDRDEAEEAESPADAAVDVGGDDAPAAGEAVGFPRQNDHVRARHVLHNRDLSGSSGAVDVNDVVGVGVGVVGTPVRGVRVPTTVMGYVLATL